MLLDRIYKIDRILLGLGAELMKPDSLTRVARGLLGDQSLPFWCFGERGVVR